MKTKSHSARCIISVSNGGITFCILVSKILITWEACTNIMAWFFRFGICMVWKQMLCYSDQVSVLTKWRNINESESWNCRLNAFINKAGTVKYSWISSGEIPNNNSICIAHVQCLLLIKNVERRVFPVESHSFSFEFPQNLRVLFLLRFLS